MMLALLLSPPLAALRRLANRKVSPGDDDDEGDAVGVADVDAEGKGEAVGAVGGLKAMRY